MARNGSGTYSRAVSDYTASSTISSAAVNAEMDDIATALTGSIAKDGQTTTTQVIPFDSGISTNTVAEETAGSGVTVDSVLLKDGRVDWNKGAAVASATSCDIWATTGNVVHITGTTDIDNFGTASKAGLFRVVEFDGVLSLNHSSTIDNPGGANITTAAGDRAIIYADTTTLAKVIYSRADGTAVAASLSAASNGGAGVSGSAVSVDPNNATDTAIAAGDEILFGDVSDSDNVKKDTVQGILDLVPASGGKLVQVVNTQTGAVATGTTVIPYDDTIPQNTEGDEYMTLAITPTSASNTLEFDIVVQASFSGGGRQIAALFQDSTADSIAVGAMRVDSSAEIVTISFKHEMTAGTTSATTFKVRSGNGNSGTTTFNGASGARRFGGVCASSITIREISV